jgi:NAD(P)-dependent dehydrogenase (short-subunit alcohol dehydrogenase family)
MNLFDLSGKVAIVTGSTRGIGRAIAEALAEHGAKIVISSRKANACAEVAAEIDAKFGPGTATPIAASISDKAALANLVSETERLLGGIDILICNAASNPHYGSLDTISDEMFRKTLDNNILSNHWLIQLVAPGMRKQRDGAIVIVSSIAGLKGTPVLGAYAVSKAADMQLARNYAIELGPDNIRINCIVPGLVKTDFARALWEDPVRIKATNESIPLRRIGDPDDIAGAAVFLAARSGAFTTGQTIVMDGGATI